MCTFFLENRNPLHPVAPLFGSLLLRSVGPVWHWEGTWTDFPARHEVEFDWHPVPQNAIARTSWNDGAVGDSGPWELKTAQPPPNLLYHSFHVETWPETWLAEILITM